VLRCRVQPPIGEHDFCWLSWSGIDVKPEINAAAETVFVSKV